MPPTDRLSAVPPRWWAISGGVVGLVIVIALVLASTGGESVSTSPGTEPASSTSGDPSSTDRASTTVTSSTIPPTTRVGSSTSSSTSSTSSPSSTSSTVVAIDLDDVYELDIDPDQPAVEARVLPEEPEPDEPPPTTIAPPPWADSTFITEAGYVSTDGGCSDDLSAAGLDWFFSSRVGPVIGWDYQHVYPLGDGRYLWLFQDAFLDHSGTATTFDRARFIHNAALVQDGTCFTLMHRGSDERPDAFETGDGLTDIRTRWFWPMGGELVDGELLVFWAEMIKDPYDPDPPDGLGWHPERVYLGTYDAVTLERTWFGLAPDSDAVPIYGYAVSSDDTHTYLFGNTFEQNLLREGGFWSGRHSATKIWLARVPKGRLDLRPEYRTSDGWSPDRTEAVPILDRFYAENPMQPRYLDGQWVAATAVNGYWGDDLAVDVADNPWGPWTTVQYQALVPRNADPLMNTYHAHPLPWRDGFGSVLISVSNNARNMERDAWPHPHRYRPTVIFAPFQPTPPTTTTTTTTTTSTTTTSTSTTTTTVPPTTTTSTTSTTTTTSTTAPTTTTTSTTSTTSTSTTVPETTTSTSLPPD